MADVIYPPCKYCGASHGMGVEEMATGIITPMDICYKCLWKPLMMKNPISCIELSDHINGYRDLLKSTENKLIHDIDNKPE